MLVVIAETCNNVRFIDKLIEKCAKFDTLVIYLVLYKSIYEHMNIEDGLFGRSKILLYIGCKILSVESRLS